MLSIDDLFSKINKCESIDELLDLRGSISDSIKVFDDDEDMLKDFKSVIIRIDKKLSELSKEQI